MASGGRYGVGAPGLRIIEFFDDFEAPDLDTAGPAPHYLPMWSSRAQSAAAYALADSELRLTVPPGHGLWCPVRPRRAAAGVGPAIGRVLRARGQHGRAAAVP